MDDVEFECLKRGHSGASDIDMEELEYSSKKTGVIDMRLDEGQGVEDDVTYKGFKVSLHTQRIQKVLALLLDARPMRVVDIGCGVAVLCKYIKQLHFIGNYIAFDIDEQSLHEAQNNVKPLTGDYITRRTKAHTCCLYKASIGCLFTKFENAQEYNEFCRFDSHTRQFLYPGMAVCVEVIEHLEPQVLNSFPQQVLGYMQPKQLFISTPNVEFNVLFDQSNNKYNGLRHHDHKFEWTRAQFQEWCIKIARQYRYSVVFGGVGSPPPAMKHVGHCTQFAVFTHLQTQKFVCEFPQNVAHNKTFLGVNSRLLAMHCIETKLPIQNEKVLKLLREAEIVYNYLIDNKFSNDVITSKDVFTASAILKNACDSNMDNFRALLVNGYRNENTYLQLASDNVHINDMREEWANNNYLEEDSDEYQPPVANKINDSNHVDEDRNNGTDFVWST